MFGKTSVLAAALGLLLAWPTSASAQRESHDAATIGPQRIDLVVNGLSCPFCAYGLEKKLKRIEGLDSINIDFKTGRVLLLVQDGSKATDERIAQLVKDAGFVVTTIERAPRQGGKDELSDGASGR